MYKILQVHNSYQIQGGEDLYVKRERQLLKKNGNEVFTYQRDNEEINKFTLGKKLALLWESTWSKKSYVELRDVIKKTKIDLGHFHNFFPLITPSAYYACHAEGVPVVQTLHNYRLVCPGAQFVCRKQVCEKCLHHSLWHSVLYRCYRNSYIQTFATLRMLKKHRNKNTWWDKVDAYIALTKFAKDKYVEGGLPAYKLYINPIFLPDQPKPLFRDDNYFVYLGRLAAEKGVIVLLRAVKILGDRGIRLPELKIVGDGPDRHFLERFVTNEGIERVSFLGKKISDESIDILRKSIFLVVPSTWYEGFPSTIVEAFACGKPVIASDIGSLSEIVQDGKTGFLFQPGNVAGLAEKMQYIIQNKDDVINMGKWARKEFDNKYTARLNYDRLVEIYSHARENFNNRV